jgi:hypothetical protein
MELSRCLGVDARKQAPKAESYLMRERPSYVALSLMGAPGIELEGQLGVGSTPQDCSHFLSFVMRRGETRRDVISGANLTRT